MAVWLECGIKVESQNVSTNQSTCYAWINAVSNYGSYNYMNPYGEVTFWGLASGTIGFNHSFGPDQTTLIYEHRFTVTHNADGTGAVSLSAWFDTGVSSGRVYGEAALTLPTIARTSKPTITPNPATVGSPITITTNRASSSFTHTITAAYNSQSVGTIGTNVGASLSYTPPIATYAPKLTNRTSGYCSFTTSTFNGSTKIGEYTSGITLNLPSSVVPTISTVALTDTKGYYSKYGGYVLGKSNIQATITAAGVYGSTIKSYGYTYNGKTVSGQTSKTLTLGIPTTSGTNSYTVTALDTRIRSAGKSGTFNVLAYSAPTFTSACWAKRYSGNTENDEGTTIRIRVVGSTTNLGNKGTNTATVKIEYKLASSNTWTSVNSANRGVSWDYAYDIANCPNTNAYDIRLTATDQLGTSTVYTLSVGTAQPVMDFLSGGKGVAIGSVATVPNQFKVGWKTVGKDADYQNVSSYTDISSMRRTRVHNHGQNGSSHTYILIAQNSYDVEGTSDSGDIEIHGTMGAYQANGRAYIHIVIPTRAIKSDGNSTIHVIDRTSNWKTAVLNTNIIVTIDSSGILRVYLDIPPSRWYFYNLFIETDDTITVPLTSSTSMLGTTFFNLDSPPYTPFTVTTDVKNSLALRNGIYLNARNTAGTIYNLLGIASTNLTEMQWTPGGLRGRVAKTLWSGTWSSGSITVSDTGYYNMFLISMQNEASKMLCVKQAIGNQSATTILGIGGMPDTGSYKNKTQWIFAFAATTSNYTTWTLLSCMATGTGSKYGSYATKVVTKIEGVI